MKVAFVKPPLIGHKVRGTGVYANNLKKHLGNTTSLQVQWSDKNNLPNDADLYHFPYFDPFFLTLPIIRSKPTVVTIHDLIPIKFPQHFPRGMQGEVKWQIQKLNVKRVQAIITDSLSSKNDIASLMAINEEKIYSIYLAPNPIFLQSKAPQEMQKIKSKYKLPEKFSLYVGDVNWNKNLPNIIRAVKKEKIHLVVINELFAKGELIANNNSWLDSLKLALKEAREYNNITRIGKIPIEELKTIYQLATVLVFPSFYEGFGLPVVESMASGCPVITSDAGSLKEVAGNSALIVNPNNVSEIGNAITKVFKTKHLRTDLIRKGKEQAKKFSWEKTAKQTYEVYKSVLSNN